MGNKKKKISKKQHLNYMKEKASRMREHKKRTTSLETNSCSVLSEQSGMESKVIFLNLDDQQRYLAIDSRERNIKIVKQQSAHGNLKANNSDSDNKENEQRSLCKINFQSKCQNIHCEESTERKRRYRNEDESCVLRKRSKNETEELSKSKGQKRKYNRDNESCVFRKQSKNDKEGLLKEHTKENEYEEPLPYDIDFGSNEVEHVDNPNRHRIIELRQFMNELRNISRHESLFACGLDTLKIVSENRKGLVSQFRVTCQMCHKNFLLKSSSFDVNKNAVSGIMAAGCGNAQLNQITAAIDLPNVSEHIYNKVHDQVCNEWELTAWEEMRKAGEREREAAIKEGRVNKDGVAMIDVELDACWCKRSYKSNYSAPSGAAAIIGRRFGQVLFLSVKNKYCCVCARAENRKETVKEHSCYKNFAGPSTAMEADIIVEGFKRSIEMHNIIYSRFIADGDASTYAKILEARPYPNITVEKISCKNHILRNFCNKLQQLKTDTKFNVAERKLITNEKILGTRKYITDAMKLHGKKTADATENIKALHKDLNLSIYHGFGIHRECNKNICTRETKINLEFTKGPLWQRLRFVVANVASHARSLIENVDSNLVESFNGVIAKFTGGKRVNYALRRSYQARCAGAVVSFNSKKILSTVHQHVYQQPVGTYLKKFEETQLKKRDRRRTVARKKKRYVASKPLDNNYGDNADKPDMDEETFELSKKVFLKNLEKTEEERNDIERRTILQSESGEWMELRRNLLTASNFGKVVKRNVNNSCRNIVKNMLYKLNIDHVSSISHGKKNEKTALTEISNLLNLHIAECGLYIDEKYPFLGATPDGVIPDQNTIVEVKCPIIPYKIGIEEAIKQGKMHFWRINKQTGEIYVNKKSDWYLQVQGQMHISKKNKCILAAWYGEGKIKTEIIEKDDEFWYQTMEPKLISFYFDCLLPELVDPRHTRNRPIRDPVYVKNVKKCPKKCEKLNIDCTTVDSVPLNFNEY